MRSLLIYLMLVAGGAGPVMAETGTPVRPLADDFVVICESPSPADIYCYTPGIIRMDSGRLVATMDFGGKGIKKEEPRGRVFVSDDRGKSWNRKTSFPFVHARPFVAGKALYVLGHSGDLKVIRSDDGGDTWGESAALTENQKWHQSACNCISLKIWWTGALPGWWRSATPPARDATTHPWSSTARTCALSPAVATAVQKTRMTAI